MGQSAPNACDNPIVSNIEKKTINDLKYCLFFLLLLGFNSWAIEITDVDFRREPQGAGLVKINLSNSVVSVDVHKVGENISLEFYSTELPEKLDRRLDVVDFATPVHTIDSSQKGSSTIITIEASGQYDYRIYQIDTQYMVSLRPRTDAEVETQNKNLDYTGDPLSLNFQNIDVRSVLQIIAEFTSINLIVSDSVTGSITLRLDNVPWDLALETVLRSKGLDRRLQGNILMVAPAAEIAEQERLQIETNKQLQQLTPLGTTFVRVKYADAGKVFELFTTKTDQRRRLNNDQSADVGTPGFLSARGSAIVDERTNTIILTDTEDKINEFRDLIDEIDIPIKQVLIEARIVIANNDFKKELGATWGLAGISKLAGGPMSNAFGDRTLGFSGQRSGLTPGAGVKESFTYSADEIQPDAGADGVIGNADDGVLEFTKTYDFNLSDSLAVDLGIANPSGSFSLGYLTDNFFIDLELSALESDGYGEIVSQPKVLTGDKQQAIIKSGTEIAYEKETASGATSVEFKEAVLLLEVTPQITPDNRIIMDLLVSQDSVGSIISGGEPSIDVTRIQTQALVGDGQTLVLGGIFQTEEVRGTKKVPFLGDIPYLGKLFRNDLRNIEKREILIFITPKILDENLLDR
ncbi:MAG: type IV pilus secretin PilQ [Porticoccaceae bacterium]|nr:type IV pilus secretin PilQ [Porticoccaceae bacterium]